MANHEPPFSNLVDASRYMRYIEAISLLKATQARIRSVIESWEISQWRVDMLRRLSLLFRKKFPYAEAFFMTLDDASLQRILDTTHIDIARFTELSLLPTPHLLEYLFDGRVADLKLEIDKIRWGGFEKENPLHRELEYSRFMTSEKDFPRSSTNPFVTYDGYRLSHEGEVSREIDMLVADNRDIQAFIEGEALKGKVLVLWNDRYGSYYVGNFLREPLEHNPNIRTGTIRVGSTQYDSLEKFEQRQWDSLFLTPEVRQYIEREHPTIIIIDGTKVKGYPTERFPASMTQIHSCFKKRGRYTTRYWIPGKGELELSDIRIWSWWYHFQGWEQNLTGDEEHMILLRANGRSSGLFDDPEEILEKQVLVFWPKWLTQGRYYNGTLTTLLGEIREAMTN